MVKEIEGNKIHVTHLNVRSSISILLIQILFVNLLSYFVIVAGYLFILNYLEAVTLALRSTTGLILLLIVFIGQFFLIVYGLLQWMNDYYELTPETIIHKKGLIFRKREKYSMQHVHYITISQDLIGKVFNYGTITLFDQRRTKLLDLYLIHNPTRYREVFEKIKPDIDESEAILREEFIASQS